MPPKVSSFEDFSETFRRPCCEKYIRVKFSFFFFGTARLTLAFVGTPMEPVVAAAETDAKDSGHGDVDVSE
jgi:hypothetical protein